MLQASLHATDNTVLKPHLQAAVLVASYLHLAKSLFHTDDLVYLVGAGDTAQYANAD